MFKAFFELQDPMIPLPRREKYPNWKVCPVLQWMNYYIFPTAWLLGIALSAHTAASTTIRAMGSPTGSTISAITTYSSFSSTSTGGRKRKFNDTSLGPRGHYQICLFDHTKHLPVRCKLVTNNATGQPVRSQTKCDLHNYLKGQSRYKMMYCPACSCNANLCINCCKLFHEEPDIVGKKKSLKRKLGVNFLVH